MTNQDIKDFLGGRLDNLTEKIDESIKRADASAASIVSHEEACADERRKTNERLSSLEKHTKLVLGSLGVLGLKLMAIIEYLVTGTWL